jgi:hypothetical protein
MSLNQVGFGAPAGAVGGNILAPVTDAVNQAVNKRRSNRDRIENMAVGHALQSLRDSRKFEHERGMQTERISHQSEMAKLSAAVKIREGQAGRRHEARMAKGQQAHELAKTNAAFAGITQLGKGKRVSAFNMDGNGGMNVTYNKPTRRRTTPRATGGTSQAPAPVSTPSRSTAAPEVPGGTTQVAPVIRDSKTGRAMRNPAYTSSSSSAPKASSKAAPKAARRPRSK